MTKLKSILTLKITLAFLLHLTSALYEDQVGKFDWKRSFIGKVTRAKLDQKRLIVVTEENVLASLNLKNGQILWRQLLEEEPNEIKALNVDRNVVTVSGGSNGWYVRTWDVSSGTLLTEWSLNSSDKSEFAIIDEDVLINVVPVSESVLEITNYLIQTGEVKDKTIATFEVKNCVAVNNYYVCLDNNVLYYTNLIKQNKEIQQLKLNEINNIKKEIPLISMEDEVLITTTEGLYSVIFDKTQIKPLGYLVRTIKTDSDKIQYKLEQSDNPNKLIQIRQLNPEMIYDFDFPIGLGAPIILTGYSKNGNTHLLLETTDNALLFIKLNDGKILWTREEALSNVITSEFVELPVSELDASIETEFKLNSNNVFDMLIHRLTTQFKQLTNLIFNSHVMMKNGLIRDDFGLHKLIVVVTKIGKIFAIDTLTGSIAWSYRLPQIKHFDTEDGLKVMLFNQRSARYAPLPAQCTLIAKDAISGYGVVFQFDPITGNSLNGVEKLNFEIIQTMLLPYEDENYLKPILIINKAKEVNILPESAINVIKQHLSTTFIYLVDKKTNEMQGYNLQYADSLKLSKVWNINFSPSKIVNLSTKPASERVHSQGRVLPDRSVYYKYINPNLIAVATLTEDIIHKHVLSIYLVDGVTGLILYSTSHRRAKGPVHMAHSENWLVYSYFNERFRRTEMSAAELYEGHKQSNSTHFSSYAVSLLPDVQTQCYIFGGALRKIAVTITERGITNKFLLLGLSNGAVIEIPWLLLQPRFENVPCMPDESCIPYMPEIPQPAEAVINYNQTIGRIRAIDISPAKLESTMHVLVYGLDMFYTRVAPSKTFDLLKEDFDYMMIVLVLTGLIVASYVSKYLAAKKALKHLWK